LLARGAEMALLPRAAHLSLAGYELMNLVNNVNIALNM